jgi:Uma2 family endonuclease
METLLRPPRTMLELYNCLPEGTPVQLINNQLVMSPAPKDRHQKLLVILSRRMGVFIEKNQLGELRVAPSDVFLNETNVYQPDIYFISNENLTGFQEDGFHGTPDLIIEITSPGSEKLDRVDKLKNYELCGVKEYWIVDPSNKKATGYKNVAGKFEPLAEQTDQLNSILLAAEFSF